ncbi:peptide/nickel transport system permease protein [Microbacterium terrae]|uniref:Oligopeptide transport system permease protein OppC n=1 Tax=Microbacterium terrae TaxID=69369 RepID=A0A0M2H0V3_9MICO|nr:ABC transporter permease [Microbacterium terrae]KJL40016.1 Oligopeptide transport system permease protein OppC [Microbacterium terrae]MBP1076956.1 peptide/nickel transport system permease protein [Microbacterium terrae]GLJ99550.1 ABC transporter permease [Microbacterium terrae]
MATTIPTDAPQEDRGSEQSIEQKAIAGLSQGALVRRRFLRHRGAMISLVVLVIVIVLAFTSVGTVVGGTGKLTALSDGTLSIDGYRIPGWWPLNWWTSYPIVNGGQPTLTLWPFSLGEHPFGQDTLGKDIFAQVMRGTQQSLTVMFLVGVLSLVMGTLVGALSGFFRGWTDSLLMRFTDVIIIIPIIVIGSIFGKLFGGNAIVFGVFLGLLSWTGLARLVRGDFLALREREFVDAARVAGASSGRIIFRHILPNAVGVIIVNTTLLMSAAVLTEAALSFIGFGITPPDVSLGQIISEYREAFRTRPWLFWWPGLFIVILALCINFIGDGLRDAFDPRQQRTVGRKAQRAVAAIPSVQAVQMADVPTSFDDPELPDAYLEESESRAARDEDPATRPDSGFDDDDTPQGGRA